MKKYHKINTVFLRDDFKNILEGQWAIPEFELLKDIQWDWFEKIDGTNIRIVWEGRNKILRFEGKTDDADTPLNLLSVLETKFTKENMFAVFGETDVCLYGEGYGYNIGKNGKHYLTDTTDFILFDIKIGNWWLLREKIEYIASKLKINIVLTIGHGTLTDAIEYTKRGFKSSIATNLEYISEGLIMKPKIELFNRKGERIIAKIKHRDFKKENNNIQKENFYLVQHETFEKIYKFEGEPIQQEVENAVAAYFKKTVVDCVLLDRENRLFIFDGGENIELLLRKEKYCD